jgi:hypothetical protein
MEYLELSTIDCSWPGYAIAPEEAWAPAVMLSPMHATLSAVAAPLRWAHCFR